MGSTVQQYTLGFELVPGKEVSAGCSGVGGGLKLQ